MIPRLNDAATWRLIMRAAVLPIMLLVLLMPQQASTQEQSDQQGHEGMSMPMEKPQDSAQLASSWQISVKASSITGLRESS